MRCWDDGVGPAYDCYGLLIRSYCDVTGIDPNLWPEGYRHVRDAWQHALQVGDIMSQLDGPHEGTLPVFYRRYTIHGSSQVVPAHIGVVSGMSADGDITYIHANPRRGIVEQVQLHTTDRLLGFIALREQPWALSLHNE